MSDDDSDPGQNTHMIILDLDLRAWLPPWDNYGFASLCFALKDDDTYGMYAGDYAGNILELFTGTMDYEGTVGAEAAIDCSAETPWLSFSGPLTEKEIRRIIGYGSLAADATLSLYTNGSQTVDAKGTLTLDQFTAITGKDFDFDKPPEVLSTEIPFEFLKLKAEWTGQGTLHGLLLAGNNLRDVTE
jgi:hypothetical protein